MHAREIMSIARHAGSTRDRPDELREAARPGPARKLAASAVQPSGPGWQPLAVLVAAATAALDDMDEDEYERFERLSPWRKVAYRYLAADCDSFAIALHRMTGWPIVGISGEYGPVHRIVRAPNGRFLDAGGWTDMAKLARRYRMSTAATSDPGGEEQALDSIDDDEFGDDTLAEAVSAIRQFPWAPYNTRAFQMISFRPIPNIDTPRPKED